jgi:hypothetical protein
MNDWKSLLKADPTAWLLGKDNPSVRYYTLVDILDIPGNDPRVLEAKQQIMETGVVLKILKKQDDKGFWETPDRYYTAKYKGTVWQLIILAELGVDGADDRIRRAGEFIIKASQDRSSGGFSFRGTFKNGGNHSSVIPCLTGNMVWSLIRFGYLKDSRLQKGINWISSYQRFDDQVERPPRGWPYDNAEPCWGRHTCSMGAIKALKALSEIPEEARSPAVKRTIDRGADYFLQHYVHKRSHTPEQVCKPGWRRFGFPLMYQTDALEILGVLTKLGYHDERMHEALDLLVSKQDNQGRWLMESTFNGRFQTNIESKGEPSKWVTLRALKVLKTACRTGNLQQV